VGSSYMVIDGIMSSLSKNLMVNNCLHTYLCPYVKKLS
jgi:hypothetical protein